MKSSKLILMFLSIFLITFVSSSSGVNIGGGTFSNFGVSITPTPKLNSFFMPSNTSVFGNFSFNGGWENNGFSIIDGDIYAQTGYFYNITSLDVTKQNLTINENLHVLENVTASYYFGDGSGLTGISGMFNSIAWNRSGTDVFLANTNDQVGIGDTTPQNPLEVVGGVIIRGAVGEGENAPENGLYVAEEVYIGGSGVANEELFLYEPQPSTYSIMRMATADTGGGAANGFKIQVGTILNETLFWNYEDGSMAFGTNNALSLNLTADGNSYFTGNVGIGTTSPDSKLQIDGNFTSETDSTDSIGTAAIKWLNGFFVNLFVSGNVTATGNITGENVFLPAYVSSHTNNTIPVASAGIWYNITFDHGEDEFKKRITHAIDDDTNTTFTIQDTGIYEITYTMLFEDSAASPNAHVVARVTQNDVELNGFTIEKDSSRQYAGFNTRHSDLIELTATDEIKLSFTSDDTTVSLTSHLTFGEHLNTGHITIKRVA